MAKGGEYRPGCFGPMKIDCHAQSLHAIVGPTNVLNGVAVVTFDRV